MHLGHKRTGRVDGREIPCLGFLSNFRTDAMGTEDDDGSLWDIIDRFDEDHATVLEPLDDVLVVHDRVINVDRIAFHDVEKLIDDVDGHVYAGTEAAGIGKNDLHGSGRIPLAGL